MAALKAARDMINSPGQESEFLALRPIEQVVLWRLLEQGSRFRPYDAEVLKFYREKLNAPGKAVVKVTAQTAQNAVEALRQRTYGSERQPWCGSRRAASTPWTTRRCTPGMRSRWLRGPGLRRGPSPTKHRSQRRLRADPPRRASLGSFALQMRTAARARLNAASVCGRRHKWRYIAPHMSIPRIRATADRPVVTFDESTARQVLLLRACETGGKTPASLWSPEDREWATRLTRETAPADATPTQLLALRARHACQRLLPRDAPLAALATPARWQPGWVLLAMLLGGLAGALADSLGGAAGSINLLAPPLWGVLAWNGAIYLLLAWQCLARRPAGPWKLRGLRLLLSGVRRMPPGGPHHVFLADWGVRSAPLMAARAALLLHAAAAGLALGLVAGMYLRALVWDYRAGWQSTFLDAETVRGFLAFFMAPASGVTGIAVPGADVLAQMRTGAGAVATAGAGAWIHLLAATLVLGVVLPRLLLAARAAWVARHGAARFELALDEPYFQRLLHAWRGTQALVQVWPYGAAPAAQAVLGLRTLLAAVLGEQLDLRVAPTTAHGDESPPATPVQGVTLRVLLVDLASTPEAEAQGRFLATLCQGAQRVLLLADEAEFIRRFANAPQRLDQRRAAWQQLADAHGVPLLWANLQQPDQARSAAILQRLLAA